MHIYSYAKDTILKYNIIYKIKIKAKIYFR